MSSLCIMTAIALSMFCVQIALFVQICKSSKLFVQHKPDHMDVSACNHMCAAEVYEGFYGAFFTSSTWCLMSQNIVATLETNLCPAVGFWGQQTFGSCWEAADWAASCCRSLFVLSHNFSLCRSPPLIGSRYSHIVVHWTLQFVSVSRRF